MTKLFTISAFILTLALALPAMAAAQVITSYTLTINPAGTTTVTSTTTLPVAAGGVVCNLTPMVGGSTINPLHVSITDPVNAGKSCIYVDPGTGPLASLPFSTVSYTATIHATNTAGNSPESAASLPFSHPGVAPVAPTGLQVIQ